MRTSSVAGNGLRLAGAEGLVRGLRPRPLFAPTRGAARSRHPICKMVRPRDITGLSAAPYQVGSTLCKNARIRRSALVRRHVEPSITRTHNGILFWSGNIGAVLLVSVHRAGQICPHRGRQLLAGRVKEDWAPVERASHVSYVDLCRNGGEDLECRLTESFLGDHRARRAETAARAVHLGPQALPAQFAPDIGLFEQAAEPELETAAQLQSTVAKAVRDGRRRRAGGGLGRAGEAPLGGELVLSMADVPHVPVSCPLRDPKPPTRRTAASPTVPSTSWRSRKERSTLAPSGTSSKLAGSSSSSGKRREVSARASRGAARTVAEVPAQNTVPLGRAPGAVTGERTVPQREQ